MTIKYLSVCSGIEAASVAWHGLGWTPVGFSEIEPFPSAVLAHHYPSVPNFGDMTKHESWPIEPGSIDLLVGGTPCQSFSVAGLRAGLSDPRGGLMLTYLEIARRLRPRWVVWENVPGVLSSNGGRDFGSFLGAMGELGYGVSYRVLDAQWVRTHGHPRAVPQRRRRVFVVGCLGDWTRAAQVLFERESVQRDSSPRRTPREGAAGNAEGGVGAGRWWDGTDCAGTLTKQNAGGGQRMPDKDNLGAVLQPIGYRWQNNRDGLQQDDAVAAMRASTGGSGFHEMNHPVVVQPVPIQDGREMQKAQNGLGIGTHGDPAYTLDTTGAQAVGQPVPFTKAKRAQSVTDDETGVDGQVNPTLSLFDQGDTRATTVAVAFPINTLTLGGRPDAVNDKRMTMGVGENGDPQFTLQAAHGHAVAHAFYSTGGTHGVNQHPEVSPAVKVGSGLGIPSPPAVAQAMTVRRLTPRECERLQGFPDDYTLIPWRKKQAEDCPDGPRYKALGNSMAVNCMAWIGERIAGAL